MDDGVRTCEPVTAEAIPPQGVDRDTHETGRLPEVLDRIVDGYRANARRVIQEWRRPIEVVPHDLDAVVARLRADDMRKLQLAATMPGGPVVVGRFEDGHVALRQVDGRPTRAEMVGGQPQITTSFGEMSWSTPWANRENLLRAVVGAGYEVAPVEGDPLSFSHEKSGRVQAYEEVFGPYVSMGWRALLGPEGAFPRELMQFPDDPNTTQIISAFGTGQGDPTRGVMLWLRA